MRGGFLGRGSFSVPRIYDPFGPRAPRPPDEPPNLAPSGGTPVPTEERKADTIEPDARMQSAQLVGADGSLFRPDPEKMQRVFRNEDLVRVRDTLAAVQTLSGPPIAELDSRSPFHPGSVEYDQLGKLAQMIRPDEPETIVRAFVTALQEARLRRPRRWRQRGESLDSDWFLQPWYVLDARHFWVKNEHEPGGFSAIAEGLREIAALGFANILMTNHYETEAVSGGHGVVLHAPGRDLGGAAAFVRMLDTADQLGLRIVTSAAFHRTSVLHPWFTAAAQPQSPQAEYYKEALPSDEGRGPIAPHLSAIRAATRFGGSAPGFVELDLSNGRLLKEVFDVLGDELNVGVLGKRSPDLSRNAPGRVGDALRALLKLFMESVAPRSIFVIHSPFGCATAPLLVGSPGFEGDDPAAEQADLVYATELSIALRESIYAANRAPLEAWIRRLPALPQSSGLLAFVEDEKSVPLNLTSNPDLWLRVVSEHRGLVSPDGSRVALRHGDLLDGNPEHVALSLFVLYMLPATPLVQYGTEVGAESAREEHQREETRRTSFLRARSEERQHDVFFEEPPILQARLTAQEHASRLRRKGAPVRLLMELNRRWRREPELRSRTIKILPVIDRSVLAWLKGRGSKARLMVANLSGSERQVSVAEEYLSAAIKATLAKGDIGSRARVIKRSYGVELVLRPYGWALI